MKHVVILTVTIGSLFLLSTPSYSDAHARSLPPAKPAATEARDDDSTAPSSPEIWSGLKIKVVKNFGCHLSQDSDGIPVWDCENFESKSVSCVVNKDSNTDLSSSLPIDKVVERSYKFYRPTPESLLEGRNNSIARNAYLTLSFGAPGNSVSLGCYPKKMGVHSFTLSEIRDAFRGYAIIASNPDSVPTPKSATAAFWDDKWANVKCSFDGVYTYQQTINFAQSLMGRSAPYNENETTCRQAQKSVASEKLLAEEVYASNDKEIPSTSGALR